MEFDVLSNRVISCAIEVHRELAPGLLESTYEQCLLPLRALRVLRGETVLYLCKSWLLALYL